VPCQRDGRAAVATGSHQKIFHALALSPAFLLLLLLFVLRFSLLCLVLLYFFSFSF
jgi:hypothetical protein